MNDLMLLTALHMLSRNKTQPSALYICSVRKYVLIT
jgi:hypothetical protein